MRIHSICSRERATVIDTAFLENMGSKSDDLLTLLAVWHNVIALGIQETPGG